jgi:hypothetical protein
MVHHANELAQALQALLAELFGVDAPIANELAAGPCIVVQTSSYGDPGGGYTVIEQLELAGMAELRLTFRFAFHELTGQCDDWTLEVFGAPEPLHARIFELFHPSKQTAPWNPSVKPEIRFY